MFSTEFRGAETLISTNTVDTSGAIFTRVVCYTLINVWKINRKKINN